MSTPQEIQRDIERTRADLSANVDRLSDKVSPGKVVGRRVDKVRGGARSFKDRVMGSSDEGSGLRGAGGTISSAASSVGSAASSVGSAASSVGDTASNAPAAVRRQAQGNPLAAGLIAFGVGWLLASLAPATDAEQHVAEQAEEKAKQLAEPAKQVGQQLAEDLKQPVQEGVEQVKSTATDAAQQTADQARSAAQDVQQPMRQ